MWNGLVNEHVVSRTVRDSALILDYTAGPDIGDPYIAPPPARPFIEEVGVDPGRLRVGFSPGTPPDKEAHFESIAAMEGRPSSWKVSVTKWSRPSRGTIASTGSRLS